MSEDRKVGPGAAPTRLAQPLILIRGFGGLNVEDERRVAYQGFNDGTVYPQKRGENYIYEGLILRFMKSDWQYQDATNVVGYFANTVQVDVGPIPDDLKGFDPKFFTGDKVVIDKAMALRLVGSDRVDPLSTLWIFRYYDLEDRKFHNYGLALVRLIGFIRALAAVKLPAGTAKPKVNIIAHSMGGLLVREAVQVTYPKMNGNRREAEEHINKIVTLGTPHQGISFQFLRDWIKIGAEDELRHFNPEFQQDKNNAAAFVRFGDHFPLDRLLTVVGTNYRTYSPGVASSMNRLFSVSGEGGPTYNRSDGLVKQAYAQMPGAPRTFIHKCHGGHDSIVTSREAYEIATRFFFGNTLARLRLVSAKASRGGDIFGKDEYFFGVSIKPRGVDFDLFHQSAEAENCYGPFFTDGFTDPAELVPWADDVVDPKTHKLVAAGRRLIWEGYLDSAHIVKDKKKLIKDIVVRLDFYVGERDAYGIGFSDNVIFRKQYFVRAVLADPLKLYCYAQESYPANDAQPDDKDVMKQVSDDEWHFTVGGSAFTATLAVELDYIPTDGPPKPLSQFLKEGGQVGAKTAMPDTPGATPAGG